MNKFLLFTTGGGSADIMNLDSSEVALYNSVDLRTIKPADKSSLDLFFKTNEGTEIVTLKIKAGSHGVVMRSIAEAMNSDVNTIRVADVDANAFVDKHISGCSIKTSTPILYKSKIVNSTVVEIISINTKLKKLNSMTLANVHSDSATVQVYLQDAASAIYYIIKDVVIPIGTTLKLESYEIDYNGYTFSLNVKLSGSTPVDVIIK